MRRGGRLALAGLAVCAAGVAAALLVRLLVPSGAAQALLPAPARALPADTALLAGVDVAALRQAGLLELLTGLLPEPPAALATGGLDPWRDVEQLYWARSDAADDSGVGVALALGRFDAVALASQLGPPAGEPTRRAWTLPVEPGRAPLALGLDAAGTSLVFGAPETVDAVQRGLAGGRSTLPADLLTLLAVLPTTPSAWLVAGPAVVTRLSDQAGAASLPLPPLPELRGAALGLVLGEVPGADVVVLTADEAGARRLAETARGLLALAQLTARPELRAVLAELALGQEGARVRLRLRLPPERLETLGALLPKLGGGAASIP